MTNEVHLTLWLGLACVVVLEHSGKGIEVAEGNPRLLRSIVWLVDVR